MPLAVAESPVEPDFVLPGVEAAHLPDNERRARRARHECPMPLIYLLQVVGEVGVLEVRLRVDARPVRMWRVDEPIFSRTMMGRVEAHGRHLGTHKVAAPPEAFLRVVAAGRTGLVSDAFDHHEPTLAKTKHVLPDSRGRLVPVCGGSSVTP